MMNSSRTAPEYVDVKDKDTFPDDSSGTRHRKNLESKLLHMPILGEFVKETCALIAERDRDSSRTNDMEGRFGMIDGATEVTLTDSKTEMVMVEQRSPSHTGNSACPT